MAWALYGTTGTYGTLAKNGSDLKYTFFPEPTIEANFTPVIEFDDMPGVFAPYAYHNFTQQRVYSISGVLQQTFSGDPVGAKYLYQRLEDLDKVLSYMSSWSAQPTSAATGQILCLSINPFPKSSTYEKLIFGIPSNLTWKIEGGTQFISYTFQFREVYDLLLF